MKILISLVVLFFPILSMAQPADDLIRNYLLNKNDFLVKDGKVRPTNPAANQLDRQTFEEAGDYRLRFTPEVLEAKPAWRLSEILVNSDRTVTASTSTFYKHRIRSVTRCFSSPGDGISGDMSCATASPKICSGLTRFFKGSNKEMSRTDALSVGLDEDIIRMVEFGKEKMGGESGLGKVCSAFSTYLGAMNGLVSKATEIKSWKMIGYPYISNPFSEVEDADRAALSKEMKGFRRWSDFKLEGAFLEEAHDRSNALKAAANSFRVSSEILDICRTAKFDDPAPATAAPGQGEKAGSKQ